MAAKKITKKPSLGVKKLSTPKREERSYKISASWQVPGDLTSNNKNDRAEKLKITWVLDIPGKKDLKKTVIEKNEKATSDDINLNNLSITTTNKKGKKKTAKYTRSSFYPLNSKRYLYGVSVEVRAANKKGTGKKTGPVKLKFSKPSAPDIGACTFDADTGTVSSIIKTDAGSEKKERYDTHYEVTVYDSRTKKSKTTTDKNDTSTEITASYDVASYQALSHDDYVKVSISACSRGFAGKTDGTSKTYYVSYPAKPSIVDEPKISGKSPSDFCTVKVKTNSTKEHPVDQIRLEYLANVPYATVSEIPGNADWKDSGILDDAECEALTMPIAELIASPGNHTWVRLRSWHGSEKVLYRYSDYMEVKDLYTEAPSAADDYISIISATSGASGETIAVQLGWNADGKDDSTDTELTWSDDEDVWRSTEEPSRHTFDWSDGEFVDGDITYKDSALIHIRKLEEGTVYFIRARRFLDGDTLTYGPYSQTVDCMTTEKPSSLVARCNGYVVEDESLTVRWNFQSRSPQTEWFIVAESGTNITQGAGTIGATQISAAQLAKFAVNDVVRFHVKVSTGSGFAESEVHSVVIRRKPTISVQAPATLTAQPYSFTANVSTSCNLITVLTSEGATGQTPRGMETQPSGDTVHSNVYAPTWTASGSGYTATITLPDELDIWDGGKYTLSVVAEDQSTGLRSEEVTAVTNVAWAHQAVSPEESVTLTVIDEYDEDGDHTQAVQIDLVPPEGSVDTDSYDIYRMDVENPTLIGEGLPLTCTVTDEYAPFGADLPLKYRVVIRTADGDEEFSDIEYEAVCKVMRFDWADGSLELPYNMEYGDSFKKDVDIRHHMDGSIDGYWNKGVERTGSFSSSIIRITQLKTIEQARKLARYTGPVFVRLPNGNAYVADVQVTDFSKQNAAVMTIALDGTEIGITEEFMLPSLNTTEEAS